MKTVDTIVREALADKQLPVHYYAQFLHYAIDWMGTEYDLETKGAVTTVELTVSEDFNADLPEDYVDWIRVGQNRGRYIVPMPTRYTLLDNGESVTVQENDTVIPFDGYYWANFVNEYAEHLGKLYGAVTDGGDHFNIVGDKIVFGHAFVAGQKVYLQYLSSSSTLTTSLVHPYFSRTLKKFIHWQFTEWDRRENLTTKRRSRQEYFHEYRNSRARHFQMSKEDIVNIIRRNTRQSVKM